MTHSPPSIEVEWVIQTWASVVFTTGWKKHRRKPKWTAQRVKTKIIMTQEPPSYESIFPEYKRNAPLPLTPPPVVVVVEADEVAPLPPVEPSKPGLFDFKNKLYRKWLLFGLFCSCLASFRLSWRYKMNCAKVVSELRTNLLLVIQGHVRRTRDPGRRGHIHVLYGSTSHIQCRAQWEESNSDTPRREK